MITYTTPRPKPPLQLWLLAIICLAGLAALGQAAYSAFLLVATPGQALFAALLIEAGLIVEALALVKRPRSLAPWLGLAISYAVSGIYNYTQASLALSELGQVAIIALALGPLSALAAVALTLGLELRAYQEALDAWREARAAWQTKQQEKAERAAKRAATKKATVKAALPPIAPWLPAQPGNLADFKAMIASGQATLPEGLTGQQLAEAIPSLQSDRTARYWLKAAQEVSKNGQN